MDMIVQCLGKSSATFTRTQSFWRKSREIRFSVLVCLLDCRSHGSRSCGRLDDAGNGFGALQNPHSDSLVPAILLFREGQIMSEPLRIAKFSGDYRRAGRLMRRARFLWAVVNRDSIMYDYSGVVLKLAAQRAINEGLYAPSSTLTDARFSILRTIFRIDKRAGRIGNDSFAWYRWLNLHGWEARGRRTIRKQAV